MLGLLFGTEEKRINFVYMGMLRGFGVLMFSLLLCRFFKKPIDFSLLSDLHILNFRNLMMTVHGFFFAFSFHYLEVPIVYTISNAGPIIVFILDYFMNKISVSRRQLAGIIISCLGIFLAINSHLIYRELGIPEETHSKFAYVEATIEMKLLVSMLFLLAVVGWAYGVVQTKSLKASHTLQVNLHQGFMLLFCNSLALLVIPTPARLTLAEEAELFIKVGLPMSIGSMLYIGSLFLSKKSGNVTIVGFSTVFIGYAISIIRYGETPNALGVMGSLCIGCGLFMVLLR